MICFIIVGHDYSKTLSLTVSYIVLEGKRDLPFRFVPVRSAKREGKIHSFTLDMLFSNLNTTNTI